MNIERVNKLGELGYGYGQQEHIFHNWTETKICDWDILDGNIIDKLTDEEFETVFNEIQRLQAKKELERKGEICTHEKK